MKNFKKILAGILCTSIATSYVPTYAMNNNITLKNLSPRYSTMVGGNILHYDMSFENNYLVDKVGNKNGVVRNLTTEDIVERESGNTLVFNNDSSPAYVEIPDGTVNDLKDVSMSAIINWKGGVNASWLYTLGTDSGKYLFVTPSNPSGKYQTGFASGNNLNGWETERGFADNSKLENNQWSMVTMTFSSENNTLSLYRDGVLVGENKDITYELADIITSGIPNGYIGKSFYGGDPYFSGEVADFKIFDKALTSEEVSILKEESNELVLALSTDSLNYDYVLKDNESSSSVISNLNLPNSLGRVSIEWTSSDERVVTKEGTVMRPNSLDGDKTVTLTATMTLNNTTITKTFEVTVLKEFTIEQKLDYVREHLVVNNINDVRGNLTLPVVGDYDAIITWESSNNNIINPKAVGNTPAGVVTRQNKDTDVKLTATITIAGESTTKDFTAKVKSVIEDLDYDSYIFTYFIGEEFAEGEQVYLGTSKDGLNWEEVNNHKPILKSELGEKGIRDPFIIRSPEGDKFYLIATDLRIYEGNGWGAAQMSGSQSLMIWESTDLVNWSDQRMVKVSFDTAGCTWAPEVFYDDTTGEYIVYWASRDNAKPDDDNDFHHRMYYAKTRDFYTFTEPEIYFSFELEDTNSAIDIIDTTMIEYNGIYYRWTKNEVDKTIFMEKSDSVLGEWTTIETNIGGYTGVEGPTVFKFNDRDEWCLLLDDHAGIKYFPLVTDNLESGQFRKLDTSEYSLPKGASANGPRHGTVIPVTKEEYDRVMIAYGNIDIVDSSIPKAVFITDDVNVLPSDIDVVIGGIKVKEAKVKWNVDENTFKNIGTVTVTGILVDYDKTIEVKLRVVSPNLIYFIDCGVETSPIYEDINTLVDLRNEVADKEYSEGSWGRNSTDNYGIYGSSTLNDEYAYGLWAKSGKDITYTVPLEAGEYSITAAFNEWWGQDRAMNLYMEYTNSEGALVKEIMQENIKISGTVPKTTAIESFVLPIDTEVTFRISKYKESGDPVVSWLTIDKLSSGEPDIEVPVDKTQLEILVGEARKITEKELDNIIPSVVKEFKEALSEAEELLANSKATQDEINESLDRLSEVMEMLSFEKGDKGELQLLVNKIMNLNSSEYIKETWSKLESELANANDVLSNENAMEKEILEAYNGLLRAFLNLRFKPSKEKLEDLINKAEKLEANKYTEESWAKFEKVLSNAKSIFRNEDASKKEIDEAKVSLENSMNNLQEKEYIDDSEDEEDNIDKVIAEEVMAKIDAISSKVTLADKKKVEDARKEYDALTVEQKMLVTNLEVLISAEGIILELMKIEEDKESNRLAAEVVIQKIKEIPSKVTLADKIIVEKVRKAYDALTAEQKVLVTNLKKLTLAEEKVAELEKSNVNKLPQTGGIPWAVSILSGLMLAGVGVVTVNRKNK